MKNESVEQQIIIAKEVKSRTLQKAQY